MVLGDFLKKYAAERPNREAVVFQDRRFTFRDYDEQTDRVAAGLLRHRGPEGDRVASNPNWPENVFLYLGAAKIGAVAVPVSWRFTPQEVASSSTTPGLRPRHDGGISWDCTSFRAWLRPERALLPPGGRDLERDKAAAGMIPYDDSSPIRDRI